MKALSGGVIDEKALTAITDSPQPKVAPSGTNTSSITGNRFKQRELDFALLLNGLQKCVHQLLDEFLNGQGHSRLHRLFAPYIDQPVSTVWYTQEIAPILARLSQSNPSAFPQTRAAVSSLPAKAFSLEIAGLLAITYREIQETLERTGLDVEMTEKAATTARRFDRALYRTYDGGTLNPLNKLNTYIEENMSMYLAGAYLHGSMATLDYVPASSDVDTFLILSADTATDPTRLRALRRHWRHSLRFAPMIDPFQHHGHMVATEIDLDYYAQSLFLPLCVMQHAVSFGAGSPEFKVQLRDDRNERHEALSQMAQNLLRLSRNHETPTGMYELKTVNHSVLLLPTVFLQGLGINVYKRESFELARTKWPDAGWEIVERATWLRRHWNFKPNPAIKLLSLFPNPEVIGAGHRLFCNSIPARFYPAIDGFVNESAGLADRLLSYVIEWNTHTD